MPVTKTSEAALEAAAGIIRRGGLVAFPTETVYGLGADAFSPAAAAAVFRAKGRPRFDPLIVHIAEPAALIRVADLDALAPDARARLDALAAALWPGPLTLVLPKSAAVPGIVTGGLATVAVRLPAHETARRLVAMSTGAVAAPSANPFGRLSPTTAAHVAEMLGDKVEMILDSGPSRVGVESTVFDVAASIILRPGGITREEIEAVAGPVGVLDAGAGCAEAAAMPSPGLLTGHYAPITPLSLHGTSELAALPPGDGEAFLFFDGGTFSAWRNRHGPAAGGAAGTPTAVLSETGDTVEAAASLFRVLHELDALRLKQIHAQTAPDHGLGPAINDRLRRGAAGGQSR